MSRTRGSSDAVATADPIVTLEKRVKAILPQLTEKQRRVAHFVLTSPLLLAFASADEIGRRAAVDAATVVRFCQMLGYTGLTELRDAIRATVPPFLTAEQKVGTNGASAIRQRDLFTAVLKQDADNVLATASANNGSTMRAVIATLLRARHVFVVGFARSGYLADLFAHDLTTLGISGRRVSRDLGVASVELSTANAKDVVVGFSLWRYHVSVIRLLEAGRETGAKTIAIADSAAAPIAASASYMLVCTTTTPKLTHSLTAIVALLNGICAGIAGREPASAARALHRLHTAYEELDRLWQ